MPNTANSTDRIQLLHMFSLYNFKLFERWKQILGLTFAELRGAQNPASKDTYCSLIYVCSHMLASEGRDFRIIEPCRFVEQHNSIVLGVSLYCERHEYQRYVSLVSDIGHIWRHHEWRMCIIHKKYIFTLNIAPLVAP